MSLKSYFRKKRKYDTQADLKDMTAEQILRLDPSDVGYHISDETGGVPLKGVKLRALYNLLAYKKVAKETGLNPQLREKQIDAFLKRENLREDPEVNELIVKTTQDVMNEKVSQKQLENRFRKLNEQSEIPYTDEEKLHMRLQKLALGGKNTRNKRRKSRKTRHKKSKKINKRNRRSKIKI